MEIKRSKVVVAGQPRGYAKGSVVTGAKGFVILSGSTGVDVNSGKVPESAGEQARLAMKNIKSRLEEYGVSLQNIFFIRRYMKGEFPNGIGNDPKGREVAQAIADFWRENCPEFLAENNPLASTLIGVTALAMPEYVVEIEVMAAI